MLSRLILKEFYSDVPIKNDFVIRKEDFGLTIFNKKNLKHIHLDKIGEHIIYNINSKNTIGQIVERVANDLKKPKALISLIVLEYLKSLNDSEFIKLESIPNIKTISKQQNHPLTSAPNQISWIITNQCNLRCSHCANKNSLKMPNELTTTEAIQFVNDCAKHKVFILNISGGEPFIRKDFFEILEQARDLGIEIGITTNGTIINEETVKKLQKLSPFNIHISFDGIGKVHDSFRNKSGVYSKVIETIALFKKYNIPFGLTTSISKLNFHDIDNIKDFVKREGITSWEIYYAIPIGNLAKNMALSDKEYVELAKKVDSYKKELASMCNIFVGDSLGYFCDYKIRDEEWKGCLAGLNHCAIGSEGEIKGCPIQPDEFIEGNIRKDNLFDIWRNPRSFKYNREPIVLEKHCKKCKYSKECRAGCKTAMYTQHTGLTYNNLCVRHIQSIH